VNNGRRNLNRIPSTLTQGEVLATFTEYADAVRYVERLMTADFPPNAIAIVGNNLKSVERVRGRLSTARVALGGASTGLMIGLIFGLLTTPAATSADAMAATSVGLVQPMIIGAGLGMLFNVVRFSMARNKRGFISQSLIMAKEYEVQVPGNLVEQAKRIIAETGTATEQ
jgi:F0F1-type ATP synthase assembly protein I